MTMCSFHYQWPLFNQCWGESATVESIRLWDKSGLIITQAPQLLPDYPNNDLSVAQNFTPLMTRYILKCPMQTYSPGLIDEMWATSDQTWTSALGTQRYHHTCSQSRFHGNTLPWLPGDWLSELAGTDLVDIFYPEKSIIQAFIFLPAWSME